MQKLQRERHQRQFKQQQWAGRNGLNGGYAQSHAVLALEPGPEHMEPSKMMTIKSLRVIPTPAVSNHRKDLNTLWFNKFSACDLFSLRCGVLTAEIILNSTCFETKSYMENNNANEVYVYIDSSSS